MKRIAILTAALVLAPAAGLALGGGKGTSAAAFLKIAPGARAAAMGEAFSALADDVHAVYYNPAGLAFLKQVEAAGMHESRFAGIRYDFAALAAPLLSWRDTPKQRNAYGVAALSFYSLSVEGIERRGTTETDEPLDTFGAGDVAYALSYAYALPGSRFALGGTAKLVDSRIDGAEARALAVDAGGLYRAGRASGALGLRHLGAQQRFRDAADPLPLTWYGGAAYRFSDKVLASAELDSPRDGAGAAALGGEYRLVLARGFSAAARLGFNSRRTDPGSMSGLSLGLGLAYNGASFDFAWLPAGELGNAFRYSLLVRF
ncbi:MAG TPA: hypothetical protein DEB40_07145 [Elusimicrobia bacterium]|nr:hypothetical protein [Elusimicrobiota bacterium]HBT61503.1 hypothetical protein [Elusimicrobiota bacterium]